MKVTNCQHLNSSEGNQVMSDCDKVILRQKILDILPYLSEFSVEHNYVDFEISGTDCTSIFIDKDSIE